MKKIFLPLIFLSLLLALMSFLPKDILPAEPTTQAQTSRQYLVQVGDVAPDFEMTLADGGKVKLSDLRGKLVMLQFTASWCGVCRKEMPHIEKEIWQQHQSNPLFALYGIDLKESVNVVKQFGATTGITYPLGLDPQGAIFKLYAEENAGVTRNVIIGADGKILMLTRLFDVNEFADMVKLINRQLIEMKSK